MDISIIGAGGHSRSLISLLSENDNYQIIGIYDQSFSHSKDEAILDIKLVGHLGSDIPSPIIIAIGDNQVRKKLSKTYFTQTLKANIISNTSTVRESVYLGNSNQIFPMCFINSLVEIGNHCIINSKSLIEHESKIGDFCHISVGAIICGRVSMGANCFIGAGAIVKDKISICNNVTIGAGAVVVKDIIKEGTYIGNPLKKIA